MTLTLRNPVLGCRYTPPTELSIFWSLQTQGCYRWTQSPIKMYWYWVLKRIWKNMPHWVDFTQCSNKKYTRLSTQWIFRIYRYCVLNVVLKVSVIECSWENSIDVLMYSSITKKMELLSTQCSSKTFIKLSTQSILRVQGYCVLN